MKDDKNWCKVVKILTQKILIKNVCFLTMHFFQEHIRIKSRWLMVLGRVWYLGERQQKVEEWREGWIFCFYQYFFFFLWQVYFCRVSLIDHNIYFWFDCQFYFQVLFQYVSIFYRICWYIKQFLGPLQGSSDLFLSQVSNNLSNVILFVWNFGL